MDCWRALANIIIYMTYNVVFYVIFTHFTSYTVVSKIIYSTVSFQDISILLVAKDTQSNSGDACCL